MKKATLPNQPEWPDFLDALNAAPDHHKLLFENDRVRVLDTHIAVGDRTPVHTHQWPGVLHIFSWSNFAPYNDKGNIVVDSRKIDAFKTPPAAVWSDPLTPHSLENAGEIDLHVISVELKAPAP